MDEVNENFFLSGFAEQSRISRKRSARSRPTRKTVPGSPLLFTETNFEKNLKPFKTLVDKNPLFRCSIPQFLWAIRYGELENVTSFLKGISFEMRAKVLNQVENGLSPLHYAVRYGKTDIVEIFLQNGADVNLRGEEDKQPIHFAAKFFKGLGNSNYKKEDDYQFFATRSEQKNCLQFLIDRGADVNAYDCFESTPLHYACQKGHTKAVQILLNANNIKVKVSNEQRSTPLHEAVGRSHIEIVNLILSSGDSGRSLIEDADESGTTPLMLSCRDGNTAIAELLINTAKTQSLDGAMSRLLDKDIDGNTALHVAVEGGNKETVELILNLWEKEFIRLNRLPNNSPCKNKAYIDKESADGFTPLHLAADLGSLEILETILKRNPMLNVGNTTQRITPLHLAAKRGHLDCLDVLLSRGCNTELVDINQLSPFLTACKSGNVEVVKMLMNHGANAYATDFRSRNGAFLAIEEGHDGIVEFLLQECNFKKILMERDSSGNTILHEAAFQGNHQLLKNLYNSCKSWMNLRNDTDQTPLHTAAMRGKSEAVKQIVQSKRSSLNEKDERSRSPLHLAACNGHISTVSLLLDLGAATADVDLLGMTPLHLCVAHGHLECAKVILEADKTVINNVTRQKETALHWACITGREDIVKFLLECSADVTARLNDGRNALDLAIDNNNESCAHVLIDCDNWLESMRNATDSTSKNVVTTPFRKLIQVMPDLAERALNKCISSVDKNRQKKNIEVKYSFELLEDTYHILNWKNETNDDSAYSLYSRNPSKPRVKVKYRDTDVQMQLLSSSIDALQKRNKQKSESSETKVKFYKNLKPYSSSGITLLENHPLSVMVKAKREKLLRHPVVTNLLFYKWKSYGFFAYLLELLLYLMYLTILTIYLWTTPPRFAINMNTTFRNFSEANFCIKVVPEAYFIWGSHCQNRRFSRDLTIVLVLSFSTFHLLKKFIQFNLQRKKFFLDFTNYLEILLYVLSILVISPWDDINRRTGIRDVWQWEMAAFTVLLAWINLGSFLRFTPWGIYIFMVTSVGKSFLRFLPIIFIFLIGFAMSFFVLLQNQDSFESPVIAFIKTLVMTVGEFEFTDIFLIKSREYHERVFYRNSTLLVFVVFVFFLSLLLTNLLVGIAVDDIALVYDQSLLRQLAVQVDSLLRIEHMLPLSIRRRIMAEYVTRYPNKQKHYNFISSWLEEGKMDLELPFAVIQDKTETEVLLDELQSVKQSFSYFVQKISKLHEMEEKNSVKILAVINQLKTLENHQKNKNFSL